MPIPSKEIQLRRKLGDVAQYLPPETHPNEVAILSNEYWNSINYKIKKNDIEAEERRLCIEKHEEMKQKSKALSENWSNAIVKARKRQLEAREKRLHDINLQKLEIDREEARVQAHIRKTAIDKAKTLQIFQADRFKTFHGALLFSEVRKEQEVQREMKKNIARSNKEKEIAYYNTWKEDHLKACQAEEEKERSKYIKNVEYFKFQKEQEAELMAKRRNEAADWISEGIEVRRLAAEHETHNNTLLAADKEDNMVAHRQVEQQIEDNKTMREYLRLKSLEEDEDIRLFAAGKKKMAVLRIKKEKEIFKKRQDWLGNIQKELLYKSGRPLARDNDILLAAQRETEANFLAKEEAGRQRMEKANEAFHQHYLETIARHQQEAEDRKFEDNETKRKKMVALQKMQEKESKKKSDLLQNELDLVEFWKRQEELNKLRKDSNADKKLRAKEENNRIIGVQEQFFGNYANKIIEHCRNGNRELYPLLEAAKPKVFQL